MNSSAQYKTAMPTTAQVRKARNRMIRKASLVWGLALVLAKFISVLREMVLGRTLGAGEDADVFFAAFTLPDFVNYLVAGGMIAILFIPLYDRAREKSKAYGWKTFSTIVNFHLVLLLMAIPLLWSIAPSLSRWIAPGFNETKHLQLVYLIRIILPAQLFHIVGGFLSALLQAHDRAKETAFSSTFYGLATLGGMLIGAASGSARAAAEGFAWGTLAGAIIGPFGMNLVGALREGLVWAPRIEFRNPRLWKYLRNAVPVMLAVSIVVSDDWLLRRVGSTLGSGQLAILTYAKKLMMLPVGFFGMAAALASFRTLSKLVRGQQKTETFHQVTNQVRQALIFSFGMQVVLAAAAPHISRMLFGGRMTWDQHQSVGLASVLFGIGMWAWVSQAFLSRVFFAGQNTWTPSILGTLVTLLAFFGYPVAAQHWGYLGLALASSIAISLYVVLLQLPLSRYVSTRRILSIKFLGPLGLATIGGVGVGLGLSWVLNRNQRSFWGVALPPLAALVLYLGILRMFRLHELQVVLRNLGLIPDTPAMGPHTAAIGPSGRETAESQPYLKVFLTGGGTGGHVNPTLAIFRILQRRWHMEDVLYVGAKGGAEETIVGQGTALSFVAVPSAQIAGASPVALAKAVLKVGLGVFQCLQLILARRPNLIVGTGGYASGPLCFAASISTRTHNQVRASSQD